MPRTDLAMLPDGALLRYGLWRRTGKQCLVLVHPLAMDLGYWHGVVERLPGDVDVLAYDVRGHGGSVRLSSPWSARQHASDLLGLMDVVGWSGAVVAGASMGGCIAIAAAGLDPGRVRGLGLIDTTAWYGEDAADKWRERAGRALENGMPDLLDFQLGRWFTEGFLVSGDRAVTQAGETFLANDPASYAQACAMLGAFDGRRDLAGYAGPCRIVVGRDDYATPLEAAVGMASLARSSVLDVIEDARHFTPLETPDAVAANIVALLATAYRDERSSPASAVST